MGGGARAQKRAYIRKLSTQIRKYTPTSSELDYVRDDPIISGLQGLGRSVLLILGRNRNRLLQQSWSYWVRNTAVVHDYASDVVSILSNPLSIDELRSELELEVMYKWALQTGSEDPTGLASNIIQCKSRRAIIDVFQECRLEVYNPYELVLYQGTLPSPSDGHFTILQGSCDVINLAEGSVQGITLQDCYKQGRFEAAKQLLLHNQVLANMSSPSGFGELSCLTGVKRHATIRAGHGGVRLLVVPQATMLRCFDAKRAVETGAEGSAPSEAIELFRQVGLASKISPAEVMKAANSMIKRTLDLGDVLFLRNDPASSIFLVVSGDIVLDTGGPLKKEAEALNQVASLENAFLESIQGLCFRLGGGSILGDEGFVGLSHHYESTAAVSSQEAVVFEAVLGTFGHSFLVDHIKSMRYTALAYKELPRWSMPVPLAEINSIYGSLNSLRKCIANSRPTRGTVDNPYQLKEQSAFVTPAQQRQQEEEAKRAELKAQAKRRDELKAHKKSKTPLPLTASSSIPDSKGARRVFPKLGALSVLFLKSISATCKKSSSENLKVHARENILTNELLQHAAGDEDLIEATAHKSERDAQLEDKLRRGIESYRERNKATQALNEEEEGPKITLSAASNMLAMLSSAANAALTGAKSPAKSETEEEEEEVGDEQANDASSTGGNSLGTFTSGEEAYQRKKEILGKPRIVQYLLWLERKGKSAPPQTVELKITAEVETEEQAKLLEDKERLEEEREAEEKKKGQVGNPGANGTAAGFKTATISSSSSSPPKMYWRPPSPPAPRPVDPILAETKSRPAPISTKRAVPKELWPKRETAAKLRTSGEEDGPSLESLRFVPPGEKLSLAERLKAVPSSGYGQQKVLKAEKEKAELQEALETFSRLTVPTTRKVSLLPWQRQQQLDAEQLTKRKKTAALPAIKSPDTITQRNHLPTGRAGDGEWGDDDNDIDQMRGAISYDIEDPDVFLKLLREKTFPVRSQHKPTLGWKTRTMKVSANATEVEESGSEWFKRKLSLLGITDEEVERTLKGKPSRKPKFAKKVPTEECQSLVSSAGSFADGRSQVVIESEHKLEKEHEEHEEHEDHEDHEHEEHEEHEDEHDARLLVAGAQVSLDGSGSATLEDGGDGGGSVSFDVSGEAGGIGVAATEATSATEGTQAGGSITSGSVSAAEADVGPDTAAATAAADQAARQAESRKSRRAAAAAAEANISWSSIKAPSPGLRVFREALEREYSSRQFLDGKKKHDSSTLFGLERKDQAQSGPTDEEPQYRSKGEMQHLLEALLPLGASLRPYGEVKSPTKARSTSISATSNKKEEKREKRRDDEQADEAEQSVLGAHSSLAASEQAGQRRGKDHDLEAWKDFSVRVAVNTKQGPHWSLPVLEGTSDDPTRPRRKKSSLKFGGGRLAYIPSSGGGGAGTHEADLEPETYLSLFQRTKGGRGTREKLY